MRENLYGFPTLWRRFFCVATAVDTPKIRRDRKIASMPETSPCNLSLHLHVILFRHYISSASLYLFYALCRADVYIPQHHDLQHEGPRLYRRENQSLSNVMVGRKRKEQKPDTSYDHILVNTSFSIYLFILISHKTRRHP